MATSETHLAHPYVDVAHRAALLYSFGTYVAHGIRRDTTNQFEHTGASTHVAMTALILGEIGGFAVLLAGFVAGQFF
jgi:hypothetical protein